MAEQARRSATTDSVRRARLEPWSLCLPPCLAASAASMWCCNAPSAQQGYGIEKAC